MAHFAQVDDNNVVMQVIVVSNEDILDSDGNESEEVGIAFIQSLGLEGNWVQTSYNHNFRGCYAGVGWRYDADNDVFVAPAEDEISVSETSNDFDNLES